MAEIDAVVRRLGGRAESAVPIGPLTTYRVGGEAAVLVRADASDDLDAIATALSGTDVPVLVIGRGSNLLVHDDGFEGIVVVLGDGLATVEIEGTTVTAGGAASLPVVARRSAAAGLTGFEWAVGVPGSIGGAVRMNAGGHGSDMAASLVSADVIDLHRGVRRRRNLDDLDFDYRSSSITSEEVVIAAELELAAGDRAAAEAEISDIVRWRREHQPGGHNAGSVFTNPPDDSAGRLIDDAGCKGLRLGSAEVSPKHANFIQADDGGSAGDVFSLMLEVRDRVAAATGVVLHPETRLVGFPDFSDSTPQELPSS